MPEGPLGFNRLTSLGPLVDSSVSDVPLPQFKTKTFEWDKIDLRFQTTGGSLTMNTIESPGGRGVERGSSFSLDGAYNDHRQLTPDGYKDYVTLIYQLDKDKDMPFFYINPIASKDPMRVDGRDIVLEGPSRLGEAEVAVKSELDPKDAVGAVITIDEETIKEHGEERIESMSRPRFKEEQLDATLEKVELIKSEFTQLERVPQTEFRKAVRDAVNIVDDIRYDGDGEWSKIEKETRGIHTAIADSYGIDYQAVKQRAEGRL